MIDDRFALLCQKHLDGETTPEERAEIAARIERDPEARRHHDELVAVEGLLLAVATTERVDPTATPSPEPHFVDPLLADASRGAVPAEEEVAGGAWLSTAAGALLLLAIVVWGGRAVPPESTDTPVTPGPIAMPVAAPPTEFAAVPADLMAIPVPTDDPTIQFAWIGRAEPAKGRNE